MSAISRYLRDKRVSQSLKKRITAYLEFEWKNTSREEAREREIIQQLPQNMRMELIYEANSFFFSKFSWSKNFSFSFLQLLAQYVAEKKFLEGDILYQVRQGGGLSPVTTMCGRAATLRKKRRLRSTSSRKESCRCTTIYRCIIKDLECRCRRSQQGRSSGYTSLLVERCGRKTLGV